jgi:hypothetical protein
MRRGFVEMDEGTLGGGLRAAEPPSTYTARPAEPRTFDHGKGDEMTTPAATVNANDLRAKLMKFGVTPNLQAKTSLQAKISGG